MTLNVERCCAALGTQYIIEEGCGSKHRTKVQCKADGEEMERECLSDVDWNEYNHGRKLDEGSAIERKHQAGVDFMKDFHVWI